MIHMTKSREDHWHLKNTLGSPAECPREGKNTSLKINIPYKSQL